MATANKKLRHDIFDGEVALRPRAFFISGSGKLEEVPDLPIPVDFAGTMPDYYKYVATSSNDPFLPPQGGMKEIGGIYQANRANSTNATPGKNPYSYRRIPFVHKIGGSNQISTVGNPEIAEEILRFNLYGKDGSIDKYSWLTPFSAATVHFTVFPFGRSAPLTGETESFEAADNFVHARGNLSPTVYTRQRFTWIPKAVSQNENFYIWSGSGELNGTYTALPVNDTRFRPNGIVLPLGPEIIFNNSTAATNDLATNPNVGSAYTSNPWNNENASDVSFGWAHGMTAGGPIYGAFGGIHPYLTQMYPEGHPYEGKAKYYELSLYNPSTGIQDNAGPITYDAGFGTYNYWPVNKWIGTNTNIDPNTPNSATNPSFINGHHGERKNLDVSLTFRSPSAGLIVKGLIEIY